MAVYLLTSLRGKSTEQLRPKMPVSK